MTALFCSDSLRAWERALVLKKRASSKLKCTYVERPETVDQNTEWEKEREKRESTPMSNLKLDLERSLSTVWELVVVSVNWVILKWACVQSWRGILYNELKFDLKKEPIDIQHFDYLIFRRCGTNCACNEGIPCLIAKFRCTCKYYQFYFIFFWWLFISKFRFIFPGC